MTDFFLHNLWAAWLLASVLCLLLELTSGDLFILCFSIGAAVGAVCALLGLPLAGQIVVFVICSLLSLWLVRPAALRRLHRGEDRRVSNAEALLGRVGRVTQPIQPGGFGRVAIDGDDWKAQTADGQPVPLGARVKVVKTESIILTVVKQ